MSDRLPLEQAAQVEWHEGQIRTLSGEIEEPDLNQEDDLADLA